MAGVTSTVAIADSVVSERGFCKDCLFLEREMVQVEEADGQRVSVMDTICGICDVFKSPLGFCDIWESKE